MGLCPVCNNEVVNIQDGVSCKKGCFKERQIIDVDYFYHYVNVCGKEYIIDVRGGYGDFNEYCERMNNNMMNMVNAVINSCNKG